VKLAAFGLLYSLGTICGIARSQEPIFFFLALSSSQAFQQHLVFGGTNEAAEEYV